VLKQITANFLTHIKQSGIGAEIYIYNWPGWEECCIPSGVDKAHADLATRSPSPKVRRDHCLTTHNTQKRQTSMSLTDGIRTCNPRKGALDRDATGTRRVVIYPTDYPFRIPAGLLGLQTGFCGFYTICPGKHWDLTLKRVKIDPQKSVCIYNYHSHFRTMWSWGFALNRPVTLPET
jgi:hypothetical protein